MAKELAIGRLLDFYGCFLSEKQRTLAAYYYNEDLSAAEIAENEGISRQAVCDILRRVKKQLLDWERECGYCAVFAELHSLAAQEDAAALRQYIERLEQ